MVTLTETAAKKISELRLEEGKPEWGLRIRLVGGGCSGMSYELGWDETAAADDNVVESHGVRGRSEPAIRRRQRDRLRGQQHAGGRLRHQEPQREVVLRLRLVAPVLAAAAGAAHEGAGAVVRPVPRGGRA
jgi:Iron-sulphur cluster biosynthesis